MTQRSDAACQSGNHSAKYWKPGIRPKLASRHRRAVAFGWGSPRFSEDAGAGYFLSIALGIWTIRWMWRRCAEHLVFDRRARFLFVSGRRLRSGPPVRKVYGISLGQRDDLLVYMIEATAFLRQWYATSSAQFRKWGAACARQNRK
ncbi:MAG: hypothetical protein ACREO5_00830 [Candidatus Binatia bacterium]